MAAKFVVKETKGGQMMFNLVAPNGEIVLTSEQYKSKGGLKNGIKSVKEHAKDAKNFKHLAFRALFAGMVLLEDLRESDEAMRRIWK